MKDRVNEGSNEGDGYQPNELGSSPQNWGLRARQKDIRVIVPLGQTRGGGDCTLSVQHYPSFPLPSILPFLSSEWYPLNGSPHLHLSVDPHHFLLIAKWWLGWFTGFYCVIP